MVGGELSDVVRFANICHTSELERGAGRGDSIGRTTPFMRTQRMCRATSTMMAAGKSTTWMPYICPKLRTLKKAPKPEALSASLALTAIHCDAKFCCER